MAETFVTLEEAAELEGLNYYTLYRRIQRNPGSFKTWTKERDGGKDGVLVALSSLSKKARRGYKEKVNISGSDVVVEQRTGQETPWYVGVDLNWYLEKCSKQYYQAVELGKRIQEFLNYDDGERTAFSEEFAEELGISQRTLYRYAKDYLEATAWAMRLHKESGHNYDFLKVLSLCRKPKEKFTFPSLDDKVRAYIENVWFNKDFAANDGTVEMLYMKLEQVAALQGWEYPSYQTVTRYINYLMEERRAKNAHFLAAKGAREYKNKVMVKGSRDTKSLPVLGLLQGDEHTFDCWVAFTHPNGKVTAIKPRLVGWVDTRSRTFLGDIICRHANSQILKLSLLKVIYGTPGGVPQWLLIDNGKDYNAKDLTGVKRSERKKKAELQFDEETKGFYRSIGIQDEINSLPFQPWSKAQIERFFGTVCSSFTKWMFSYTGTLTGSKTAAKIKKDIPKMLERGQLLTMEEFYQLWSKWLNEVYHKREHKGLKRQGEKLKVPMELFMKAEDRYYKPAPPKSYASILMMKAERVHAYNIGIRKFGYEYRAQELCNYHNEKVDIKYDPEDITRLYVYTREGKKICEAVSQELLLIAPRVSQKALEEHKKMQNTQLRNDKELLEEFRTPYEQRGNVPGDVVGALDLMVKGKGDKVVALPQDKQFASELRDKKNRQKQDTEDKFFSRKAQDALSKLRQLG